MPGLRAAELEVLYNANTTGIDKGEQKVKDAAQRIESKPIVQKVGADVSDALAGMDRVEAGAGDIGSAIAEAAKTSTRFSAELVQNFLESDRAAKKTAEEIERVLTRSYNVSADEARRLALITKGEFVKVETAAKAAAKTDATIAVDVDDSAALAGMDRVEAAAKQLVSERAVLQLDAEVSRAEKALERAKNKVEDLSIRANAGFEVTADLKRAETALGRAEQQLDRLQRTRATVEVDADTVKAVSNLDKLEDAAKDAGGRAGDSGGSSLVSSLDGATRGAGEKVGSLIGGDVEESLISALTAIPIAGGIVLAGVAIGKAITGAVQDGLQQEVGFDRLEALTGISPGRAMRIGRAAGEAYANVFGDSVEANMDTARLALQDNLIDPRATTDQAKKVIEGLAGISDVYEEDVKRTAETTTVLLSTGLAKSAGDAFDLLAAGQREGLNRSEDLLDTLTEYPVVLRKLGLSGSDSLGLFNQGLKAGARNTDVLADALKEFQIRATDGSDSSADGFRRLGLDATETTAKIARGGADARDGLDQVLRKLRETEDPVMRNAAAVELFGTKAEDLGDALFSLDLSNAADQLGQVQGAAQRMFDTLSDNDATKIEQAGRNIEVAADGIKGALAAGFAEPLADVATFVSQNRGPVLEFFLALANGALDFGDSMVEGAATGTEALGTFVSGPLADAVEGLASVARWAGQGEAADGLQEMVDGMRQFDDTTSAAAAGIRTNLGGMLDEAREKLNQFGDGAVAVGYVNDASLRLADALDHVGDAGDGTRMELDAVTAANLSASEAGSKLEGQVRAAAGALQEQITAAQGARESQDQLKDRFDQATGALAEQLQQMGLTKDQADQLVAAYASFPQMVSTAVTANTEAATNNINQLLTTYNGATIRLNVATDSLDATSVRAGYRGGILDFMAAGGIPDLTPMSATAAIVSPETWRVVGDRPDVPEAFVPMDNSPRSLAIQRELNARQPAGAPAGGIQVHAPITITGNPDAETIALIQRAIERAVRDAMPSGQY